MHRAVAGLSLPRLVEMGTPGGGWIPREAPRSHRQSGSTDIPQSHTFTELCQAQPLPAEEGETPRWETAAPGGVGSTGKHPGFIPDPRASRWATHVPSYTRLSIPQRGGRGGGSPPEGTRSPTRGGVSREAPRMHPGSVDIPLCRTCAAHPESGTAPTGRHERRPHVGWGQPGLSGCVPAGDTGRAPRNCLQEECGLGTLRRGEIRRSQELLLPFLAPCLQHSRAPAPQLPGQPHGAAPHGAAPHGTGVLPVQPLMAPGCSQRSPPNRGDTSPLQD